MENASDYRKYNIDICLCIDKTGSMTPVIDTVKNNALNLYRDINQSMENKGKHVGRLRIRVIWFGDYGADGAYAMILSDFLRMPEQMDAFTTFVKSIKADGGGDIPEDGLEALAYAIRSDWCKDGWKKRHIIAIFTDAPAHDLGTHRSSASYPKVGMPKDFGQLTEMWGDEDNPGEMNAQGKRLLLFAPDISYWQTIAKCWENVVIRNVAASTGLQDVTYQVMLDTIVNSVG